jgi:hypothetical protein
LFQVFHFLIHGVYLNQAVGNTKPAKPETPPAKGSRNGHSAGTETPAKDVPNNF